MAPQYELGITNLEVEIMFHRMVAGWFQKDPYDYDEFIRALWNGNVKDMNLYMNRIAMENFSYFDTGSDPSREEPERFYHGFVLGLLVTLRKKYVLTSNRESGFGRYDVMLEPRDLKDDAIILEFKVQELGEDPYDTTDCSAFHAPAILKHLKSAHFSTKNGYFSVFCGSQVQKSSCKPACIGFIDLLPLVS